MYPGRLVVVIPGHNLGNSQVSVYRTIGPTLVTICNFSYFAFWFWVLDLGSGCFISWSLHSFDFYDNALLKQREP